MKVYHTPEEQKIISKVAYWYQVDPLKLSQAYDKMLESNFEQDLDDLAKDHQTELKKEN